MIKDGMGQETETIGAFLMIGQSNMAGRGELNELPPIENEKCFMLRMGRWQKMRDPVNPDRPVDGMRYHSGVSLASSFADACAQYTGEKIGLIPCADGGTRICQWLPGEILFDHAVMMTRLALRTSELRGILWHQGESDCSHPEFDPAVYKERLLCFFTSLRREIGAGDVPVLLGDLSEQYGEEHRMGENWRVINRILREVAEELPNCAVVPVEGLALKPDRLHFCTASCRELGRRYFDAYRKLAGI